MTGLRTVCIAAVVSGLALVTGCADPFEGTLAQVSGDACGISKFTVKWRSARQWNAVPDDHRRLPGCEMSFDSCETRDLEYSADVSFTSCAYPLNGSRQAAGTCALRDSEDEATCSLDLGPCGSTSDIFRKVD